MPDTPVQISPPQLPGGVIVPPPKFGFVDYPASWAIGLTTLGAIVLLVVTSRFDPSKGALTISLIVVLAVVGVLAYSVTVTVPRDETTAAVIGALMAAFGGVITFWLKSRDRDSGGNGPPP
jgi:FtsH-binding integral membrane protein